MPPEFRRKWGTECLTLGFLCLPCCVRDTAWSWFFFDFFIKYSFFIDSPCIPHIIELTEGTRNPNIKTFRSFKTFPLRYFRSLFSVEFPLRHYILIGQTQRCVFHHCQNEEMKILNISFPNSETNPQPSRLHSHVCAPAPLLF